MESLQQKDILQILKNLAQTILANRDALNEIDGKLGDADFGTSIAEGFLAVQKLLPELKDALPGNVLAKVGMILVKSMGGASGPLFGTLFMKAGKTLGDKTEIGAGDFAAMFTAGLNGIKTLGKSQAGDKTLIDALEPATQALAVATEAGDNLASALEKAKIAAGEGVENTKKMIAARGRAHYVGERGLGFQDAGATAILHLFTVLADYVKA